MKTQYFAYGSNMNVNQMLARCPGAILGETAVLSGWSYYLNGNGYAGIEKNKGQKVYGCLWKLCEKHWYALDRYEGVETRHYKRIKLEVEINFSKKKENVWVYLSNNRDYGRPTQAYQNFVLQGARQLNLPVRYLKMLESWSDAGK